MTFRTEISKSPAGKGLAGTSGPQPGKGESRQAKKLGNGKVPPSKKARGGSVKTLSKPSTKKRSRSAAAPPVTGRIAPAGSATSGNRTTAALRTGGKNLPTSGQFKKRGLTSGGASLRGNKPDAAIGDPDGDGY